MKITYSIPKYFYIFFIFLVAYSLKVDCQPYDEDYADLQETRWEEENYVSSEFLPSSECCNPMIYDVSNDQNNSNIQNQVLETPWIVPGSEYTEYSDTKINSYYEYVPDETSPLTFPEKCEPEQDQTKAIVSSVKPPYRLKIGDRLQLSLYGFRDARTERIVQVDPTGNISYLFINTIYALGKTIDELRKELEEKVKLLYPHVIVTASALDLIGDSYTVMGEVNNPGTKPITGNSSVLSAIALAGGFPLRDFRSQTVDYADLDRAFLARNGDYLPLDFNKMIREGDLSQDIPLQGGDYIYIPSLILKEIYVLGEFNRPFVHTFMNTASLTEVITWARGVTALASSRIVVIRGSLKCPTTFLVDINLITKGCQPDFLLCPGDIVYAPPARFTTFKETIKTAIRIFIGAVASQAGFNAYLEINPKAQFAPGIQGGSTIVNPGQVTTSPSPTIIVR